MSGQQNSTVGGCELIEKLPALHFIGELGLRQFVIRGIGNRPGKVVKCEPGPAEIKQGAGPRPHDAQVAQDGASRRGGEEEKEDRPEEDHDWAEVERDVRQAKIEIAPPDDAAHCETMKPAAKIGHK